MKKKTFECGRYIVDCIKEQKSEACKLNITDIISCNKYCITYKGKFDKNEIVEFIREHFDEWV